MRVSLRVFLSLLAAPTWVWAQQGSATTASAIGQTIRTTPPGRQSATSGGANRAAQPIYLTGQVVMSDGKPPPEMVRVIQRCDGLTRNSDYAKGNGTFRILLNGGVGSQVGFDASIGQTSNDITTRGRNVDSFGNLDLSGCTVSAVMHGHKSSEARLGRRGAFDNPDVGKIVLTPLEGVTGSAVSVTGLNAPPKARQAFERARQESLKEKPDLVQMREDLDRAVQVHPKYAAAWNLLGRTKLTENDVIGAREAFGKSIEADQQYLAPYAPLVKIFSETGDHTAAVQAATVALELNPHADDVRFYQAVSLMQLGRHAEAATAAGEIINRGAALDFPQTYQVMGVAYANLGHAELSARYFRMFLKQAPGAKAAAAVRNQLAAWERDGVIKPAPAQPKPSLQLVSATP